MTDSELLNWTQVGPDGTIRILIGDEKRGQVEVVFKVIIQTVTLNGSDPTTGLPMFQMQANTLARILRVDPGWRVQPKPPEGGGYR